MKEMVAYRDAHGLRQPVMEWKYLLFNWNDHPKTIQRAIELAKAGERGHHYVCPDAQSVLRHVLALPSRPDEPYWPHQLEGARSDSAAGKCRVN